MSDSATIAELSLTITLLRADLASCRFQRDTFRMLAASRLEQLNAAEAKAARLRDTLNRIRNIVDTAMRRHTEESAR